MISHHMDAPSRTIVVAFSSQPHRFEWGGFLSRIHVKYVLLRDEKDQFYQDGISGLGSTDDVIEWLNRIDRRLHRLVLLGLSAGAYAALFYSYYSSPLRTIVISPVTGSGKLPDFDPEHEPFLNGRPDFRPVVDLRDFYGKVRSDNVTAFISDGIGTALDRKMVERIGVQPILVPGYGHAALAKRLASDGTLKQLIRGDQ